MRKNRRPTRARWLVLREATWQRDECRCRGPYCYGAPPIALETAHIDHILPLSMGGNNRLENLRTLCRRCHVLRADRSHRGMIAAALRDNVIPADWRSLVWE